MTLKTFDHLEQGSPEWHDARRGLVTASTVGNLITTRELGAADYQCPSCDAPAGEPCQSKVKAGAVLKTMHGERGELARQTGTLVLETADNDNSRGLTALLVAERINGWTDDTYMSLDMVRGVEDEPRARDLYSQTRAPVTEIGFMTEDRWGFTLGASPDGLVGNDGAIEVKSRRPKKQLTTVLSGEPPAENFAQLQCVLLVSQRKWIDFCSYAGGMPMWIHRVYPDPAWFDAIIAATTTFERNAADMIGRYNAATTNMPMTERVVIDQEISFS